MVKFDWLERFKKWEDSALNSSSARSLSTRYGQEKMGETEWICNPDSGCASKPNPLSILEFVDATETGLSRDEKVEEAQARYWAAMSFWLIFSSASNTMRVISGAIAYVIPRIDSIISRFTKQDDPTAILYCQLKTWAIQLSWGISMDFIGMGFGFIPAGQAASTVAKMADMAMRNVPKYIEGLKYHIEFGLPIANGILKAKKHPVGNEGGSVDFLRLKESYTSDLWCGQMDGITGTGADTPTRISDTGFHLSAIFMEYLATLSDAYRSLNGLRPDVPGSHKMSEWMYSADYEDTIHRLETFDIAKEAKSWGQRLEGYLISAAWASNKCYMKCQINMDPETVLEKCHAPESAEMRYCPADEPTTLCQYSCWTMMNNGNHEKGLIGQDSLEMFGFSTAELGQNSWEHYKELRNNYFKPELDLENGKEFTFNMGKSALTLSVSSSDTNIVADNPLKKSKNFPCFSGRDYRGLDTEAFMYRLGMGPGHTDWGEATKGKPRAWETFQHRCPEETLEMKPVTRYLNLICGLHLSWPDKTDKKTKLLHHRIMKPDIHGDNLEICQSLRAKTADMNEETANYLFCTAGWEEAQKIFARERNWVYTDFNAHWHMGSGRKTIYSHQVRCQQYVKNLPADFKVDDKWLIADSSANVSMTTGGEVHLEGTMLQLANDEDRKEPIPADAKPLDDSIVLG
ncbi:hypothetical protein SBOR_5742 [Sclerotinia borealis F-4128]|uniref:Uncharacterized protein n=1 Tax=Sclerotinia borealis (strain F-4128) TaxID=1432307 RepID=W9CGM4_SCLBF|nr:hypothetical protein SBOR_5742 [Sclerotinia borealis F-4128]